MTVPSGQPLPRAWLTVWLLWVVALLNYLDRLMITTMRDPIVADIKATDEQFGLFTTIFLVVYGLMSPLAGFVADRYSRRLVITGSLLVWSAVTFLTGQVHSISGMLTARALMGLSEAFYIPAGLALIADYHRGATRSFATGLHMSGIYAGAALGGIGGIIAEHFGWRAGFNWFGLFGVVYAVMLFLLLRDPPRDAGEATEKARPGAALRALFAQPSFLVLIGFSCLAAIAFWGINGWLPTFVKEQFKLGLGFSGITATAWIQAASFLGILVGGPWADRWSRANPRARRLVPLIGFCLAGPCLFGMTVAASLTTAVLGMIAFGIGRGFSDSNLMPIVCQVVDRRYRATAYGVLNFIGCLVGGLTIWLAGWLRDHHVDLAIVFKVSAVGLVLAGLLLLAVRPSQSEET